MTPRPFARPSLARTLGLVLLGIAVMFGVDVALAKIERQESRVEAKRFYDQSESLRARGRPAESVEQLRNAVALERSNPNYRLALGQAQFAAGQLGDASTTLSDFLEADPFSGPANLTMARLRLRQGDINPAIALYHRAIYGRWPDDPEDHQIQARFELAALLDRQNLKQDLLAELLPMQERAPGDVSTQKTLAALFLDAGSASRAAEVFRAILRKNPNDAEAHAGLAQSEFALANYRQAREEFQEALDLHPGDQAAQDKLELCDEILDLAPTLRGLTPEEQYNRSRKLVQAVLEDVRQCLGDSPAPDLIETVEKRLKQRSTLNQDLDWADELWQVRKTSCKQPASESEQALSLVLGMLAR